MKLKFIAPFLSLVQTIIIVVFVVFVIISYSYKIPALATRGFNFYYITSGSMEPTIPTGSVVYAGKYQLEDLKKGDVVTFRLDNSIVTHRIDEVKLTEINLQTPENQNNKKMIKYEYYTKGDANASRDPEPIQANQILGKYSWHLPYLGYVASFAQTPKGFVTLVVLPALVLVIWEVISLILHFKHQYEKKMAEEIAKLKK